MERMQKAASHRRRDEANTDETQAHEVEETDAVAEADRLLDEIDELLGEVDSTDLSVRALLDLVDEELAEEDDTDPAESDEKALWNLGLYAPSDLADWIQEDLSGNCPFCGQNPCIGWTLS